MGLDSYFLNEINRKEDTKVHYKHLHSLPWWTYPSTTQNTMYDSQIFLSSPALSAQHRTDLDTPTWLCTRHLKPNYEPLIFPKWLHLQPSQVMVISSFLGPNPSSHFLLPAFSNTSHPIFQGMLLSLPSESNRFSSTPPLPPWSKLSSPHFWD